MSDYSRQYTSGVSWENLSSTATPISAGNLNKMDNAILHIDEAAYTAINTKANQTTVNGCINNVAFESTTGVFTITFVNGSTTTINTALEKVVTNFTYNSATQSLVLTLEDGSTQSISLAEFITQYEFEDTATIDFTVTDGKVSAIVKNGSITGEKLNPNYLTQITNQVNSAKDYARQSQSYAVGNAVDDEGNPYREGQATDNAKHYYQKAREAASEAGAEPFIGATSSTGGTAGLVPAPLIADREKFLKGDGSWGDVNLDPFTGATSSTAGAKGMVPQPTAGQQNATLFGDGTWKTLLYDALSRYENPNTGRSYTYQGDLNDITQNCIVNTDGSNTNLPPGIDNWGFVITLMHSNAATYGIQIYVTMNVLSANKSVWFRDKGDGNWGNWRMLPSVSGFPESTNHYLAGDGTWKNDTADLTTTYTTEDDANTTAIITSAGGETAMSTMESGAKHSRLFNKVSRVALNMRKLINTVKRIWKSVGATWVSGHAYAVNDMVVYENGHVYKCKAAHTSSSSILPTNTTYWTDTTLAAEIASLNSNYAKIAPKLLWTNPKPNSGMGATTITLDHSGANYSYYRMICKINYNNTNYVSFDFLKGGKAGLNYPTNSEGQSINGQIVVFIRDVTASSATSVTITTGGYKWASGAYNANETAYIVPYQIIGYNVI